MLNYIELGIKMAETAWWDMARLLKMHFGNASS